MKGISHPSGCCVCCHSAGDSRDKHVVRPVDSDRSVWFSLGSFPITSLCLLLSLSLSLSLVYAHLFTIVEGTVSSVFPVVRITHPAVPYTRTKYIPQSSFCRYSVLDQIQETEIETERIARGNRKHACGTHLVYKARQYTM